MIKLALLSESENGVTYVNIAEEGQAVSHDQRKDGFFLREEWKKWRVLSGRKKGWVWMRQSSESERAVHWVRTSLEAKVRDCKMFSIQISGAWKTGVTSLW
jgi:hypothetical protein